MCVADLQVESRGGHHRRAPAHGLGDDATAGAAGTSSAGDAGAGAAALLLTVWIAGTTLALGVLLVGLRRLVTIARSARPSIPADVTTSRAISRGNTASAGDVRLLYGDHPALLVTWGMRRPTIILPDAARGWSDERLRVVLRHELAHIRRGDWGASSPPSCSARSTGSTRCLDGMQTPAAGERARVRRRGDEPRRRRRRLRQPPARSRPRARTAAGRGRPRFPMARPSGLERRVRAMLNVHHNRGSISAAAPAR